jgi:hypothetical protein
MWGFPGFSYSPSPGDMLDAYKNVQVDLGATQVSISVNQYRNNDARAHPSAAGGGTQDALAVKDALLSLATGEILGRAGGAQAYVDVFTGKGSPSAIAQVMRLFVDYSDRFISKFGRSSGAPRKCADWLARRNQTTWQDILQTISNAFIGLDCNGFVGNWLNLADYSLKLGPQNGPRTVYNQRKVKRTTIDEIEAWDIVVWADFGHIAAINGAAPGGVPKFNLCQSAGGGPRMNEYSILVPPPGTTGTFKLSGGLAAGDVPGSVFVVSLW